MIDRVRVASAANIFEAHMIRAALLQYNIVAEVTGEMLSGLAGLIPVPDAMPKIWVDRADAERAREILDELSGTKEIGQLSITEANSGEVSLVPSEPVTCAACGETSPGHFGHCWQCSQPLSEPQD